MSDNPLGRIPAHDRVSIRAVLVDDGEDPAQALTDAGIIDPIAVRVVFGETPDLSGGVLGDGITPNLVAVLETVQAEDEPSESSSESGGPRSQGNGAPRPGESSPDQSVTTTLPAAYGLKPLAPVGGSAPGRRRATGPSAKRLPP
jgi:hypothetical protein